jgi:hypothetical protein
LEKAKVQPAARMTDEHFYQVAWYLHMKHVAPRVARVSDALLVVSASLGANQRERFQLAVRNVIQQVSPTPAFRVASWDARSDPCLQITDYCAWAIQRKWERSDDRSYRLIAAKIASEAAPF